jgi:hypothetical protein
MQLNIRTWMLGIIELALLFATSGCGQKLPVITKPAAAVPAANLPPPRKVVNRPPSGAEKAIGVVKPLMVDVSKYGLRIEAPEQLKQEVPRCYLSRFEVSATQPAILVIRNYKQEPPDSFPALYLRANLPSVESLAGIKMPALLFVQTGAKSAVWHTAPARPVELEIITAEGDSLAGRFSGLIVSTDGGDPVEIRGDFTGSFKPPSDFD